MDEETIELVEDYLDGKLVAFGKQWPELPFAQKDKIGCTVDYVSGRNRYIGYLISLGMYSFRGVKVGLDCANGSSWNIAKAVFDALGADTYVINAEPNGLNINLNAGSTHIERAAKVRVGKGPGRGLRLRWRRRPLPVRGRKGQCHLRRPHPSTSTAVT